MYRIFLVEDDETIAKLVRRHLEKWVMMCMWCRNLML